MPAATMTSHKRVLGDATNIRREVPDTSPNVAKKRKLNVLSSPANPSRTTHGRINGKPGSSQPKSQFEEEVLEKLSQDITELKEKSSERDQQWARPVLDGFDEKRDTLCFQQIEAEGGTLHGNKPTVRLFGVTEVSGRVEFNAHYTDKLSSIDRADILCCYMSQTSAITCTSPLQFPLPRVTWSPSGHIWKPN